jgi:hypothetical protein
MVYGQRPGDNGHQGYWQQWRPAGVRSLPQCRYRQPDGAQGPGRCGQERYEPHGHRAGGGGRRDGRQRHARSSGPLGGAPRQYPQLIQLSQAEQRSYGPPDPQPSPVPRPLSRAGGPRRFPAPFAAGGAVLIAAVIATSWVIHHRAPQTCAQQYTAWENRAGTSEAAAMRAEGNALNAAGKTNDIKAADTALERMGSYATADETHPMPACADPAGFWPQVLSATRAAGDNASAAPGLAGLIIAEAPLKPVAGIEAELNAELERTAATKAS